MYYCRPSRELNQISSPSPPSAGFGRAFLRERFDCRRRLVLRRGGPFFAATAVGEAHGYPGADGSSSTRSDEAAGEDRPPVTVRLPPVQISMADGATALTWALRPASTMPLITTAVAEWRYLAAQAAVEKCPSQGAREGPKFCVTSPNGEQCCYHCNGSILSKLRKVCKPHAEK